MQLPIQTQPIDRHHRNGLSNIPLSGITPSATYKGYSDADCTLLTVDKSQANPCSQSGIQAYKKKGVYGYGACTRCAQYKDQTINNALEESLPFY